MNIFRLKHFSLFVFLISLLVSGATAVGQSFTVTATPNPLTVYPGEGSVPITVNVAAGSYSGPVNVTLSGLPSGMSATPVTVMAGSSGTLTLNVGVSADQEAFPATAPYNANSATTTVSVVGAVGSTIETSGLNLTVSLSNPGFAPASGQITLPIVTINTSGTPVTSTTTDVSGTITITSANGSTSYLPNSSDTDDTATFHVHGNTTAEMPKLPYEVKLNTSLDLLYTMGLKCPYVTSSGKGACDKSKTYILLANYDDKPMLRGWAASALANAIPFGNGYLNETPIPSGYTGTIPTPSGTSTLMPWAPHSLFVELFLNGQYEGVYQLIEKVNVDSHRVNIPELTDTDTSGDLSGGYLVEIDQHQDEDYIWVTPQGVDLGLIDPDFTPEVPEQTSYITNYTDTAENALFSQNFTDPTVGWRAYFDEATAINFYLVNDIMGNVDGGDFYSSDYFYKAPDDPFLYMGPIWDFDISSGNVNYAPVVTPTNPWMQYYAPWYVQWFKDPGFQADVTTQFNALKNNGVLSSWVSSISTEAATLEKAQANNYNRWPMLGIKVWPNPEAVGTYDGEVSYLTNYLNLRIAYFDSLFNGKAATATSLTLPAGPYYEGAQETLSAQVTGGQSPTGSISFLANYFVIGTAPVGANGVATLTTSNLPLGSIPIQAVYSGDSANALSASTYGNATIVAPLADTETNLALSTSNAAVGGPVTISVSVVPNSGSSPTGNVTVTANGNVINTVALGAGGVASFTTTSLPTGPDSLQATYSGSAAYAGSISNAASVNVQTGGVSIGFGTSPGGLSYSIDGVSYSSAESLILLPGSTHTISTTSPQASGGNTDTWTSWSDGGAQSHTITVPNGSTSYTATFSTTGGAPAAGIHYGNGFVPGLNVNGSARLYDSKLRLTDGGSSEAGSAFSTTPVNVTSFTTSFNFQLTNAQADGFMFVLQNQNTAALGAAGGSLGFGSSGSTAGIQNSVGIKFDLYSNSGEGSDSTGIFTDGAEPYTPATDLTSTGINLHSGDIFNVQMNYDGTTLTVTITDTVTNATATQSYTVNIPAIVGSNTAFAGFTAGTGGESAMQDILNWTFGSSVNYGTGFLGELARNGSAVLNGTALQLTDGGSSEAASAFSTTPVNVQSFTNNFTFQLTNAQADGFMFVLQNQGTNALGAPGGSLGFGSSGSTTGIQNSVGIKFDLYSNSGEGNNSTGIFTDGTQPYTPATDLTSTGINLHSGDIFNVQMTYDGTTLTVTITDTATQATATQSYAVNIPSIVGANTAYAGFTAGTGGLSAVQDILTWTFNAGSSGTPPPPPPPSAVPLTFATSPGGLAFSVDGTSYTSSQTLNLTPGTTHTIAVTSPQTNAGTQNTFTSWSDGGTQSHTITVPGAAATYTANFSTAYLLTTNAAPAAGGSVSVTQPQASGYYTAGSVVTVSATPNSGYAFSNWTGNVASPSSAATTVTMSAPQTVTANFTSTTAPTTGISFSNGFGNGLSLNGNAKTNGTALELTDGNDSEASSAFYSTPINVQSFTNDFTFQLTNAQADGFMFVLQNQGPTALGAAGGSLGFSGIANSVGIKFDLYSNSGEGSDSTGIFINGAQPYTPATDLTSTGINLHSGDIFQVHMTYDGTTLTVTITDTVTQASATQSYTVNIPSIVGGSTAYAGFTAGTGGLSATQNILSWNLGAASYASGFGNGMALNGTSNYSGTALQLTNGGESDAASAFYSTPQNVQSFSTSFNFQLTNAQADGFMFVIQNQGANALGAAGGSLGFGSSTGSGGIQNSVGVKFDLYNNSGEGSDSTGLFTDGAQPFTPAIDLSSTGINLHSGDVFNVQMNYNGTTLSVTITDNNTGATTSQSYTVNIPGTVGGNTAYVGFTAGTGGESATQSILNWTFSN